MIPSNNITYSGDKFDDLAQDSEGLVFSPFNPLNVEITLTDVKSILQNYGISPEVHNFNLYRRAFIHKSYVKRPNLENIAQNIRIAECPDNCLPLKTKSNERLEFLGDGVLECVAKYYLYRRFPKEDEGFMTQKKIELVKNETIGRIAYEMGLHKWLILSRHAEDKNTRTNLKKIGCLFEAFIGALFLDVNKTIIKDENHWFDELFVTGPGFQMAQKFLENVFERHINWTELIQSNNNFKNILQIKIQKEFKVTPHYLELPTLSSVTDNSSNNNDGSGEEEEIFRMGVYLCLDLNIHTIDLSTAEDFKDYSIKTIAELHQRRTDNGSLFLKLGEGTHRIKRKAEQLACKMALDLIDG